MFVLNFQCWSQHFLDESYNPMWKICYLRIRKYQRVNHKLNKCGWLFLVQSKFKVLVELSLYSDKLSSYERSAYKHMPGCDLMLCLQGLGWCECLHFQMFERLWVWHQLVDPWTCECFHIRGVELNWNYYWYCNSFLCKYLQQNP